MRISRSVIVYFVILLPVSDLSLFSIFSLNVRHRDLPDIQGRALDNIGRVYSVMGEFEKAAE